MPRGRYPFATTSAMASRHAEARAFSMPAFQHDKQNHDGSEPSDSGNSEASQPSHCSEARTLSAPSFWPRLNAAAN